MPTHFRTGASNAISGENLFQWGMHDPTKWITYFTDCMSYVAGEWTETAISAGIGTSATTDGTGIGGEFVMTGAANENDGAWYQLGGANANEAFFYSATKKLFFKARWKLSDATQSDAVCGLSITDTSPQASSDSIIFNTADGSATLNFLVNKNGTPTTTNVATLVNDTYITTGFYYDGVGTFHVFINDAKVAEVVNTNAPDDEVLALTWGSIAGAAGVDSSSWDYFLASLER